MFDFTQSHLAWPIDGILVEFFNVHPRNVFHLLKKSWTMPFLLFVILFFRRIIADPQLVLIVLLLLLFLVVAATCSVLESGKLAITTATSFHAVVVGVRGVTIRTTSSPSSQSTSPSIPIMLCFFVFSII